MKFKLRSARHKANKPPKRSITLARRKTRTRTVYRSARRVASRGRGMLRGTGGKVLLGGGIGLVSTFITPRLPPTAAVLMDDLSDLVSTFVGGKWALVGNMIGKRVTPMLVRQATGNGGLSSGLDSA